MAVSAVRRIASMVTSMVMAAVNTMAAADFD
jgi:hypothetical protein